MSRYLIASHPFEISILIAIEYLYYKYKRDSMQTHFRAGASNLTFSRTSKSKSTTINMSQTSLMYDFQL